MNQQYVVPPETDTTTYYKTISIMGKAAMRRKRAQGEWMNRPPLGYLIVRRNGEPRLEPDPKVFPLIQEAHQLRKQGGSVRSILKQVTAKGLRSRNGKPLSVAGIWKILQHCPRELQTGTMSSMNSRGSQINLLLDRASQDYEKIKNEYESDLSAQAVSDSLKADIKDLCGNLRSALDYLARDIRETHCAPGAGSNIYYFPLLSSESDFANKMNSWYPDLSTVAPALYSYLESVQPYANPQNTWLDQFNKVNNENKHDKLVEQTREEVVRIEAKSSQGGVVSWDPASVTFGSGVWINGIPVNPATQLPVPSPHQAVTRTIWVDFRFQGVDVSALRLLSTSIKGIKRICNHVRPML